ncbi:hypothetical protein D3C78_980340 [compost metagenome]
MTGRRDDGLPDGRFRAGDFGGDRLMGNVAFAGVSGCAAVFCCGDGVTASADGSGVFRVCLIGILAGIERLCAGDGHSFYGAGRSAGQPYSAATGWLLATIGGRSSGHQLCAGLCHAVEYGAYYPADADHHGVSRTCRVGGRIAWPLWPGVGGRVWYLPTFRQHSACQRT